MTRGIITAALLLGFTGGALAAEPDTTATSPKRPRPVATTPT